MDRNYLYDKLAEKSRTELEREIKDRAKSLNYVDGELIKISKPCIDKIKQFLEGKQYTYADYVIDIILADIISTCTEKRLQKDIDSFLKSIEKLKEQIDCL